MFPLGDIDPPASAAELETALADALRQIVALPKKSSPVRVEGGKYPAVKTIGIDLSGAAIDLEDPPEKPAAAGKPQPGPSAERFHFIAKPIRYGKAGLDLQLHAKDVQLHYARGRSGELLLLIGDAADGTLDVHVTRRDLEKMLLLAAQTAAAQKNVKIEKLDLQLESSDERSVYVDVEVTARKFVSAVIRVTGQLTIDAKLQARLTRLSCEGAGMVGSLVCSFVRPHLERMGRRKFPLMAFSLGEIQLRDVSLDVDEKAVAAHAAFGSAGGRGR